MAFRSIIPVIMAKTERQDLLLDLFQCEFVILPHPNIFFHLLILFRWDMYRAVIMMPYLSCKKIENDVYNFPTWQYCKYKDIFDSRIIINSTAKFYISISYQKDLLSIDTRIFTPSDCTIFFLFEVHVANWVG